MNSGLLVALLVVGGTAAGVLTGIALQHAMALVVACVCVACLEVPDRVRRVLVAAATACAAASYGTYAATAALQSPLQSWYRTYAPEGRPQDAAIVRGVLAADGSPGEHGTRLVIDVDSVQSDARTTLPLSGRVQVHVTGELAAVHAAEWTAGRRVTAPVLLREVQTYRNPGAPGDRWQQLRRTVDLVGTTKSGALVAVARAAWWNEWAASLRRRVRDAAGKHVAPHSVQAAAIMNAILIGDRAGLDDDVQRRLRAAGTYHVIAISGGNVALLTGACFFLLRLLVRSYRAVAVCTMALVLLYGWLVGGQASVQRAVVAACLYLLLSLPGLKCSAVQVLALTATMLVVAYPLTVIDAGAWLSFGATAGIIIGATRFAAWATTRPPGLAPSRPVSRVGRMTRACWRVGLGLFASTLAAELVLAPVSASLFARIGVLGLVLNFVAIPAMAIVQFAGIAVLAFDGWFATGARLAGEVVATSADWLANSSIAVDSAPWLVWRVPPTSWCWSCAYYVGLGCLLWARRPGLRRFGIGIVVVSLAVIATAPMLEWSAPAAGWLRVTVLDVGQGDAIAVQLPDGHALLVDTGGVAGDTAAFGERVVTPALWALGIRRLDWLALTHPDLDHIGGARGVVRDFSPREVWEGIPVPPNAELTTLRQDSHDRRIAWRQVIAGHHLEIGSATVDVLHPPMPDWERRRVRNDDSLVIRIAFGAVEVLLTGDAGLEFERTFRDPQRLPLRVLKVGHHGSRSSTSVRFLQTFAPQVAVVSAGRGNMFGHPAPEILARLQQLDATVFRTDRDGAVVIESDGASVHVRGMSGRAWAAASPTATRAPVRQ